jgi:glycosyltransferase involved in cell wall biosynthesis
MLPQERGLKSMTIVLPVYNEADAIGPMLEDTVHTMGALVNDYEVIVVDDGSRDATSQIVTSLSLQYPQVRLVQHDINQGYGAALFDGLVRARYEWVFVTDSDRQFDLKEISKLTACTDKADLIVGYRTPRRDPFPRILCGWGWSKLVTLLFGYTARDIDCAFKLIRRSVITRLEPEMKSFGATFSAELLVRARRAGFTIHEVPITGHRPRVSGCATGNQLHVILRAFKELLRFRLTFGQGG